MTSKTGEEEKGINGLNPALEGDRAILLALYDSYSKRFLSDNERIWSTGRIFIPLSLAGIGPFLGSSEKDLRAALLVAIPSGFLMVSWNLIAEGHRSFQERAMGQMLEIEMHLAGSVPPKKSTSFGLSIRVLRWGLAILVMLFWLFVCLAGHWKWL